MYKGFRWSVLFLFILALCVYGCSGSGSSADPMGTGTVQFVAEYSSPISTGGSAGAPVMTTAEVEPSGSLTLTVWVSNFTSDGKTVPVINERVTFTLDSPENGARLAVLNDRTASNGQARVVYTAGNNLFTDVVRVTTGVGATASVTITKKGAPRGAVVALAASPTSAAPLGFSTITATVTDNGRAVQGERVSFTLTTNNGASLSVQSGLTNASGLLTTVYQAGNNNAQDVIQAALSNGATAQVIITKSAVAGPGMTITLTAAPNPVLPGGFSIVSATVKDSANTLVSGVEVRFTLTTGNGELSRNELKTDGSGVASIVYYAWNNLAQDVLQAMTDGGGFAELIITKSGQILGYTASMAANPPTFVGGAVPGIINSILTVTVVNNSSTPTTALPAAGLRVRINTPVVNGVPGTITPSNALTGVDGKATFNYSQLVPAGGGTYVVDGYVDVNDNGVQDPTDPTVAVPITVTAP